MDTSQSFDRAAGVYDQTRPLPEPTATRGIQAILDITGVDALILDAGTGTGRISIPLLERGARLVGCDLSIKMMKRLKEKYSAAPLAQADISVLPFPTDYFDAVLTVHVLHLVGPWREAVREFRRVLKPGGSYFNIRTYESVGKSFREQVREFWRSLVTARGVDVRHPGVQNGTDFRQELESMNASIAEIEVVRYPHIYTFREELDRYQTRVYSETWSIPDEIFEMSMQEIHNRLIRDYGSLDEQLTEEVRFVMDVVRFD